MTTDFHVIVDTFPDISDQTLNDLGGLAERFGVSTMVVSSGRTKMDIDRFDRSHQPIGLPALSVVPCFTWRTGAPHEVIGGLLDLEPTLAYAIRCHPSGDWGASAFEPWAVGALPAVLADVSRPLILDLQQSSPLTWSSLFALVVSYPTLPVVLSVAGRDMKTVAALTAACPNVLIETTGLEAADLKLLSDGLGIERLLFGSGYPEHRHIDVFAELSAAGLSQESIKAELGENARRLLVGEWRPGISARG